MTDTARPTSRDVARAAGVSQATVSLVLGDKWRGRVSERTADTVRTAARDLGYRPNLAARNLRLGRTRTALLVVPTLTNEYFARVYTGAARVADDHGFGVVLYPPRRRRPRPRPLRLRPRRPRRHHRLLHGRRRPRRHRRRRPPLVMLDADPAAPGPAATVNLAIADGMRQITRHVLGLGHHPRGIAHLAADIDTWTFHERAQALADTLGTTPPTERSPLTYEDARQATERLLTRPGPPPTALICDDDVLAVGACKALRRHGLRVPHDVSVTGYDDSALATAVEPELTTVTLPADAVGAGGMTALLDTLADRPATGTELPVRLVVRGSTAPPRHP